MITAATLFIPVVLADRGINGVVDALAHATDYHSHVTVTVQLPQNGDDVVYNMQLWSTCTDDKLNPCSYLIEWELPASDSRVSTGFTAYNNGNFYRYNNERLQECHFRWDSIPFLTRHPVQSSSQFADLLPQLLAREIAGLETDSTWSCNFIPDTVCNGIQSTVLTAQQTINGCVARNVTYIFDSTLLMPVSIERENNPGSVSEQLVVAHFHDTERTKPEGMDEEALMKRYPSVFEKFRECNFTIESLRENPLPGFSLPTVDKHRYSYDKGNSFTVPTIIVFLDPAVSTTHETIMHIRTAIDRMPRSADVLFAFLSSDCDGVMELTGTVMPGEQMLMSAQSLARDCGVTSTPSIIIADTAGVVKDVIIGFNKALSTDVIEKTAILK